MRRILAILSLVIVIGLAAGFLGLGAFPPRPTPQPVHVSLPAQSLAPA